MSKSGEKYAKVNSAVIDKEYFQWLSEQEWLEYVRAEKEAYREKYGYTLTFRLIWYDFLFRNGINDTD